MTLISIKQGDSGYKTPAEVYFAEKEQSGKRDLKHDKILSD